MSGTNPRARISRLALVACFVAVGALSVGPGANPAPVAASTTTTMQSELLGWVNSARASLHLAPLRLLSSLTSYAAGRATKMASTGVMAHPSCLGCELTSHGIQYYSAGEDIAWTSYPWGDQAAQSIFNGWKGSSGHWAILMSNKYNYIGIGVAYRSTNRTTFASADLTESKDQTRPWVRAGRVTRSGSTVSWTWSGGDTWLQTHTAGLKNFDVDYRVGSGSWTRLRSGTTARSLSLSGRAGGHYYGLRVRARDNAGNISGYSAEMRIWVP
ncbi:MAG: hypothetical protein QOI92_1845 [Chloroflexota bacterium]|jgi:hypothetical protein|nr:hypothetical protein [Chloroflexota bacterium]